MRDTSVRDNHEKVTRRFAFVQELLVGQKLTLVNRGGHLHQAWPANILH